MKTLRISSALAICMFIMFLLSSCSGYNGVMRRHLSNEANYAEYSGVISDIYWYDDEERISFFNFGEIPEGEAVFEITFSVPDYVRAFLGSDPGHDAVSAEYIFQFDVTEENNEILVENGFYDAVAVDTSIEITSSSFIYMDSNFFFIVAVVYDGNDYLPFETGLSNIIACVSRNKSIL